jgi:hypothetical protein
VLYGWCQVADAEGKIHSADGNSGKGMRWRAQSGFSTDGAPVGKSVVDLFTDAIAEALRGYRGGLRLVGHSLGSQVCFCLYPAKDFVCYHYYYYYYYYYRYYYYYYYYY